MRRRPRYEMPRGVKTRERILDILQRHAVATTGLARLLGLNPSSVAYELRVLSRLRRVNATTLRAKGGQRVRFYHLSRAAIAPPVGDFTAKSLLALTHPCSPRSLENLGGRPLYEQASAEEEEPRELPPSHNHPASPEATA